jgi:hypothetical protein
VKPGNQLEILFYNCMKEIKNEDMNLRHQPVITTAILVVTVLSWGCQSGNRGTPKLIDNAELVEAGEGIESFSQIYHLYPSPAEMLSIIDMANMSYDEDLMISPANADKYLDTKSKSFMLGAYMTDLAYSALFGRHEATLDYLEVVRKLAGEIQIDQAVDDAMVESARKNVEYLDSLYNISNEAFMNVISFCEQNERSNTVVMLSAGAFTESLFLAVNLIDDYSTADNMLQHLADQKYTIHNFLAFAESVGEDDPNVVSTIEDLAEISAIYEGIDPGAGTVTVSQSEDDKAGQPKKLVIGASNSASQPSLTKEEFESLREAIIKLRTKMIGD